MNSIITILDKSGAVYIGEYFGQSENGCLDIKNPAQIIFNVDNDNKDVEITIFPVCFPEILSDESRAEGCRWDYYEKNAKFIGTKVQLNERIISQYNKVFNN
jgi:hypothetical protein